MGDVSKSNPPTWREALLGQSQDPLWRTLDRWRRRDSVLLVVVLGFVEYLLVALILVGNPSAIEGFGIALLAVPLGALVLAECVFAAWPTQHRLTRADRLALVTVSTFFALGLAGVIATTM